MMMSSGGGECGLHMLRYWSEGSISCELTGVCRSHCFSNPEENKDLPRGRRAQFSYAGAYVAHVSGQGAPDLKRLGKDLSYETTSMQVLLSYL